MPAPRLGPVTAHMGSAVLAWALDAKWDIQMRGDEHVAALVKVAQNIDYLRSGAVTLEEGALFDAWAVGDAIDHRQGRCRRSWPARSSR